MYRYFISYILVFIILKQLLIKLKILSFLELAFIKYLKKLKLTILKNLIIINKLEKITNLRFITLVVLRNSFKIISILVSKIIKKLVRLN